MILPLKRRVVAYLEVASIPPGPAPDAPDLLACSQCGSILDLHQPDPQEPSQMLGICPGCRHWYLISSDPELGTTSVKLPLVGPLREEWGFRDGHG